MGTVLIDVHREIDALTTPLDCCANEQQPRKPWREQRIMKSPAAIVRVVRASLSHTTVFRFRIESRVVEPLPPTHPFD